MESGWGEERMGWRAGGVVRRGTVQGWLDARRGGGGEVDRRLLASAWLPSNADLNFLAAASLAPPHLTRSLAPCPASECLGFLPENVDNLP